MIAHQSPTVLARMRGFSMVEALVALVVLGVGMLGIASLHVVTVRTSGSAISRMQAVNLASDLGDRIRANRNAESAYAYDSAAAEEGEGEGEGEEEEASTSCVGTSQTCSPAQMAAYDLSVWMTQVTSALPGQPTGAVNVDTSTQPTTYTITITWLEAGDSEANRQSYAMRMQI